MGLRLGDPDLWRTFASGLAAKLAGATFYAVALALYLRYVDEHGVETIGERSSRDVFHWLTYRQRYEKVRRQMARDALTGLYNRGYFDEQAARQLAHAQRANHVMSLVLIDVDDLKVTNDRDGHRSGDELLRFVADQLQGMVRAADAACRYGGDEFVVLLTTGDAAAAAIFAERLIELVDARSRELTPAPPWAPAKVTAGVAAFPADGRTVEDLLHSADTRLYHGKRLGGGRVVTGTPALAAEGRDRGQGRPRRLGDAIILDASMTYQPDLYDLVTPAGFPRGRGVVLRQGAGVRRPGARARRRHGPGHSGGRVSRRGHSCAGLEPGHAPGAPGQVARASLPRSGTVSPWCRATCARSTSTSALR